MFQQGLGNDPHGLIFPEMVGLARRLIVVTLYVYGGGVYWVR